jgi:hypothetical protein
MAEAQELQLRRSAADSEHNYNSHWNIAAAFDVDLGFSVDGIATMLDEYERDRHAGMDIREIAERLYYYTGGYPFLVSRLCKILDETPLAWTRTGMDEAETLLLREKNTLFDDVIKNITGNASFGVLLRGILLDGVSASFVPDNPDIDRGVIYGILKRDPDGKTQVSNVIFETRILDFFISVSETRSLAEKYAEDSKFVSDGCLDAATVVDRFAAFMKSEYRDEDGSFIETHARLLFLSFLKPIINGTGHYAVEPETRGNRRMDVVVFYGREEFVFELKIHRSAHEIEDFGAPCVRSSCESPAEIREAPLWRGEEKEKAGFDQLAGYLKSRGQKKGCLVSFCDNKTAPREGRTVMHNDCEIKEVIIAYRDKRP